MQIINMSAFCPFQSYLNRFSEDEEMPVAGSVDIVERITGYVSEAFLAGNRNIQFNPQTSLLGSRIIDSLGILEMIEYMEREFGITVEETEMIPENLDSVANMSKFIQHKIGE